MYVVTNVVTNVGTCNEPYKPTNAPQIASLRDGKNKPIKLLISPSGHKTSESNTIIFPNSQPFPTSDMPPSSPVTPISESANPILPMECEICPKPGFIAAGV